MILQEGTNTILQYLQYLACIVTMIAGIYALFSPERAVALTGLVPKGGRGRTEIRCVMGGLYIALGLTPFFLGEVAFTMLGIAYLVIGIVRLVSIFIDRSSTQSNWMSLALELFFGVVLVL